MSHFQIPAEEVVARLNSDIQRGLSKKQAEELLKKNGYNRVEKDASFSFFKTFLVQLWNPLIMLLAISGGVIFFAGDPFDAFIISSVILLNALIGSIQERRIILMVSDLERVKKQKSTVVREGQHCLVFDEQLVVGDILILQEGERVPADARIIECFHMVVNESILTGESEPVIKQSEIINDPVDLSEQKNMLFCGSMVTTGYARAVITATGNRVKSSKIKKADESSKAQMPLQKDLATVLTFILWLIVFICVSLFLIGVLTGKPLPELFAALLALFMCVVPQGLPVIMTIILVAGAYEMTRYKIIIKRLQALETLGRAQVVIIDKTGTLTKNELMVVAIGAGPCEYVVTGSGYHQQGKIVGLECSSVDQSMDVRELRLMLEAALLLDRSVVEYSSEKKLFTIRGSTNEAALGVCARKYGLTLEHVEKIYKKIYEIPFSSLHHYHVGFYDAGIKGVLFVIGSPEALAKRVKRISSVQKTYLDRLIKKGVRILAVGYKEFSLSSIPDDVHQKNLFFENLFDEGLEHLGFFGIQDTLRERVSEVIMQMKNTGMQVIMATGDGSKTAAHMAHEAGILKGDQEVLEGAKMRELSDQELIAKLPTVSVYARVLPDDKLRLVSLFQSQKKVVMVIGDGVNDVPALSIAHVSVAMGATGSESAKDVAHIILADDAFQNIIEGIEYGRHIFYTFKRVILYFFTTNCAEVLVMLFALAGGFPVPLLACQILWLNLVTDGFLDTALSLEPLESDLMHFTWIRNRGELLTKELMWHVVSVAVLVAFFSCAMFLMYLPFGIAYARTMTMVTLTCCQWVTALNCRSLKTSIFSLSFFSNRWLAFALIGIVLTQIALLYVPFLRFIFKTVPLSFVDWLIVIFIGGTLLLAEELRKSIRRAF